MYELIQVSEHGYYVDCPSKIGIVTLDNNDVLLIDSGNDKNAAKKVRGILNERGRTLKAILNTHSHADHIGGNAFLQEQTGCAVYAVGMEQAFIQHPVFEPLSLYGGNPPAALRDKFLMAQPSRVAPLTDAVLPPYMHILPLAGHTPDMIGFRVDDVVFAADALSSEQTLAKYQIGYLWDVPAYLASLETLCQTEASLFIPSHAAPTTDIAPLAAVNRDKVHHIAALILRLCETPTGFESLLTALFDTFGLTMSFEQYALVGSTVRSYLSWLKDSGKLTVVFENNRLLWKTL